jgi:hypothetical protein
MAEPIVTDPPVAPVTPTPPPDPTPAPDPPAPPKLAGRYDTQEQLEQGIRELAKEIDYPVPATEGDEAGVLIGPSGMFHNVKHAEQGYKALRRLLSKKGGAPEPLPDPAATPSADPATPEQPGDMQIPEPATDIGVEEVVTKAGLVSADLVTTWQAEGKLADAQYAALSGVGYPKQVVDTYMTAASAQAATLQTQRDTAQADAQSMVGGQQQFTNLMKWASSLPETDRQDINVRLNDPVRYRGAVTQLMAMHTQAVGAVGSVPLADGATPAGGGHEPITTRSEYNKMMSAVRRGDEAAKTRWRAFKDSGGRAHQLPGY